MRHHRFTHQLLSKHTTRLAALGITLLGVLGMTSFAENASAHGYIDSPASRSYKCNLQLNKNCGAVQWDPQSIEGFKGFPHAGPQDGEIASGGDAVFKPIDQQSPTRWNITNINSGPNTFKWTITARHKTTKWNYYITKQGWNQNAPLTRSALDLTPFCSFYDNGKQPADTVTHSCNVPTDRSGYHVILGVWDVDDTPNAFYQAIDVNFGNSHGLAPNALHQSVKANLDKAAVLTATTVASHSANHSSKHSHSHH